MDGTFPSWLSGMFSGQGGTPSFGASPGSWALPAGTPQMAPGTPQQPGMPPAVAPPPAQPPGFSLLGGNSNMQQNARNALFQKALSMTQPQPMKTPGWMPWMPQR